MDVGVYHNFIASVDGKAQADFFLEHVTPYLNRLSFPLAIDVELDNGQSASVIASRLHDLCIRLEALSGQKPMIYTSPGFWNSYVGKQFDDYFATLPLWTAHWSTAPQPLLPRCWTTWVIWQYEVRAGGIPGYPKRIDLDRTAAMSVSLEPFRLRLPVDPPGRITQRFGERPEYYAQFGLSGHEGTDWGGADGDPIFAAADGVVKLIARDNGVHAYGNQIRLTHTHDADTYETIYAHLRGFVAGLMQGDTVRAGQQIGYMDSTGNSTGTHLHFGVKKNGVNVDPELYLTIE